MRKKSYISSAVRYSITYVPVSTIANLRFEGKF